MSLDSDIALLGTGVAPLIAANHFLAQGKSVLLLNPDFDFFREDSELPLDPFWPVDSGQVNPERLLRSAPDQVLHELRPDFPGAIERWPPPGAGGYRDAMAPHVRSRSRLWIHSGSAQAHAQGMSRGWEQFENLYVETSDAGMKPLLLEGLLAAGRFPGISRKATSQDIAGTMGDVRGLMLPKLVDVDVTRYRHGLLEFVRERLGAERMVSPASQIEITPEGVRFYASGIPRTAKLREGMLVFWTPRLSQWILKHSDSPELQPEGVRLWEQWSLISKDPLDASVVGVYEDMVVWAEVEGSPEGGREPLHRLAVLRPGPVLDLDSWPAALSTATASGATAWASSESFSALSRLCRDFLRWEKFSIRALRPRTLLEWGTRPVGNLIHPVSHQISNDKNLSVRIVVGCDGPLVDVVKAARGACAL